MLKTNSKEVCSAVREYVLSSLDCEEKCVSFRDKLKLAVDGFTSWYCPYEKRLNPNKQAAFIDWLKGLPSELAVAFSYYDERQLLKKWLKETAAEAEKYSDDEVDRLYWLLISREFFKLCEINKVKI